jgi:ubiquinol-cytochrome c reductase iron-sulfur subunit
MSDMDETEGLAGSEVPEGSEVPAPAHRVIGTPPPSPRLLGPGDGGAGEAAGHAVGRAGGAVAVAESEEEPLPSESDYPSHANNAEKLVAALFLLAFIAGCGFIAAYVGLEVHSVDATLRSNLALGFSLSVALLAIAFGALIWVRQLMPDAELTEIRRPPRSETKDRQAFEEYFKEGAAASQFVKRPIVRRTLMLATLPLAAIALVVLRDLGPLPGTSLRHTVWSPGRRLLIYGTNQPLTPAQISAPGSMITIVPDGYQDDLDALAKATVILIKFRPGELNIPTTYNGSTLIGTMNWTVDNIVAYSKICTHVGCPVALYEQTTHHILCPCHQSTFDAATGATVIFGPAPRPLPQLPMTVDAQGYLVAKSDFTQPVGPSFWERG